MEAQWIRRCSWYGDMPGSEKVQADVVLALPIANIMTCLAEGVHGIDKINYVLQEKN